MSKRIAWEYTHHLMHRVTKRLRKYGFFYGKIKHTCKHWDKPGARQMAMVQFDRNKGCTQVPYAELEFLIVGLNEFKRAIVIASFNNRLYLEQRRPGRLCGTPVKVHLVIANYGGARTDRLHDRNSLTNALGFENVSGRRFWSADQEDGSGTFLADIFRAYGSEYYFVIDGNRWPLCCDLSIDSVTGYGDMKPIGADGTWPKEGQI